MGLLLGRLRNKSLIIIIIAFLVGVAFGYSATTYQGKTAKEWATLYNLANQDLNKLNMEKVLQHNPFETPTPTPTSSSIQLP